MVENINNVNLQFLLKKLENLYIKETKIKKQVRFLVKEFKQLEQDKELLELIIMHQYNQKCHNKKF